MKHVAVIGIGRVGLPFGLYLESLGFSLVGIDTNEAMLQQVRSGVMPFAEPGFQSLLSKSQATFTSDPAAVRQMDYIVITVGTPLQSHIETDLSNIERVLTTIAPMLKAGQCLILRSTVAPKTTEYVRKFIEHRTTLRVGTDIGLAFCPERLAEHKALEELRVLPQIIGCADELSFRLASQLFTPFQVKMLRTTYVSAELAKLFNNSARYIEFAMANQFAVIANELGQNIYDILRLVNEDYPRGRIASPGFTAGTCLRKDFGMINELSPGPDLLLAAWKINEFMPFHLTELAASHRPLTDANIAVLGYTFKSNSDDVRDSLVPKLVRYLERHIPQRIRICEPNVAEATVERYANHDLRSAVSGSDVIFVAVNHDQFREKGAVLDLAKPGAVIIDIWNCLKVGKIAFVKEEVV